MMTKHSMFRHFAVLMLLPFATQAQVAVDVSAAGVRVTTGKSGHVEVTKNKDTSNSSISPDADITGVTIINGNVYIDGIKIPKGRTSFTSPKTGKSYRIKWEGKDNVSVEEQ